MEITDPYYQPLLRYLKASNPETDRGRVLVAAAQVDEMLAEILRAFLLRDPATDALFSGPNAALSSFFNKANICRALGLIDSEEFEEISLIRKIRNDFAHSISISMNDDKIRTRVLGMSFGLKELIEKEDSSIEEPQVRFNLVAVSIIHALYNRAHYVAESPTKDKNWKL